MTTVLQNQDTDAMFVTHNGITFKVSIEEISVSRAQEMLKRNDINRNTSPVVIKRYARDMLREDGWDFFAADPIRVNKDGEILDGQQRLEALVLAGETNPDVVLKTWLYWGIPTESQVKMDQGRPRSRTDQLVIRKMPNPRDRSSIASLLLQWQNPENLFTKMILTNDEVLEFAEANYDRITRATEHALKLRKVGFAVSIAGAVYFKAEEKVLWEASNFFTSVATGENLPQGHPALRLRNTVFFNKGKGRRINRLEELYYVVRAWNGFRKGETLNKLQLPPGGLEGLTPAHFVVK
jgi:hypothetical protein